MKNIFTILLLAILCFAGNGYSQEKAASDAKSKPNFWFGPKIGLNLAAPTIDQNSIKTQFDSNAQIGIFFQFGRKLYLQPEIYYAIQKESYTISNVPTVTNVNSLKVPVMLGLRLINLGIVSAHIMAGPQGSFFLNETKPVAGKTRQSSSFNLQFGGGVDLLGFITLDVRYASAMGTAVKTTVQQFEWKNAVNVTLGLKFR